MIPSHAIRLESILRSVTEVLIPAIDPKQQLAMDQAHIIVGNLRILLEQSDKAYQFAMVELREYVALADALSGAAEGGASTMKALGEAQEAIAAARPIAALPIPTQAALTDRVVSIKQAADHLVDAALTDGTPAFRQAARQLVVAQSGAQILRERVWVKQSGFEADTASLPPIETLLA